MSVLVNAGESAIALVRTELMAPQASTNSTSLTTFGESVDGGVYDQIASGSVERGRFNAGIVGSTPQTKRKVLRHGVLHITREQADLVATFWSRRIMSWRKLFS